MKLINAIKKLQKYGEVEYLFSFTYRVRIDRYFVLVTGLGPSFDHEISRPAVRIADLQGEAGEQKHFTSLTRALQYVKRQIWQDQNPGKNYFSDGPGHTKAKMTRTDEIIRAAKELIVVVNRKTRSKDIFGDTISATTHQLAALHIVERIEKMLKMSDDQWNEMIERTGAEVAEADHPKHSVGK